MIKPKVGIKASVRPVGKKGKFALDLNCTKCGLPISKTSDFGMDCANDCAQKEFVANGGPKHVRALEKLIRAFSKP